MLWLWIGCGIMMILLVAAYCLGRYFFQRAFDAKSDKSDIRFGAWVYGVQKRSYTGSETLLRYGMFRVID